MNVSVAGVQAERDSTLGKISLDVWGRSFLQAEIIYLVGSTRLKNISQTRNLPQIGVKIKNV